MKGWYYKNNDLYIGNTEGRESNLHYIFPWNTSYLLTPQKQAKTDAQLTVYRKPIRGRSIQAEQWSPCKDL